MALAAAGFQDYHDQATYDRGWIYRATREGFIVDLIWCMANRRAYVDESWLEGARPVRVHGEVVYAVPPEELLWHKLYVMQRERCDWPDILNLLNGVGAQMDWEDLVGRLDGDEFLLRGVLSVYAWLCPGRLKELPEWVRQKFALPDPGAGAPPIDERHVSWLDSRPWFAGQRPGIASPKPQDTALPTNP